MVESTKNKKTDKKLSDEIVKSKTIKSKDKLEKTTDKVVDKKSDTKVKKVASKELPKKADEKTDKKLVTKKSEKSEKEEKQEKTIKKVEEKKIEKKFHEDKKIDKKHKEEKHQEIKHEKKDKEEKHQEVKHEKKHKEEKHQEVKHEKKHKEEKNHEEKKHDKKHHVELNDTNSKLEKVSENKKQEIIEHKDHKHDDNHKIIKKIKKESKSGSKFIYDAFCDCTELYKNFFHWNISKVLIFFWSIALGFLFVLPFIFIFIAYAFMNNLDSTQLIGGMFKGALLNDFFGNVILMIILVVFVIIYSYGNMLLFNLNNSYIDGKKLAFKNNDYFKFHNIIKFFNLTILNFLILLIPTITVILLMGILFFVSGDMNSILQMVSNSPLNYFTILTFLLAIGGTIGFIYIGYRTLFSYLVYLDESKVSKKVKLIDCISESFSKTKNIKSFFKFLLLIVLFIIITLPIKFVGVMLDKNLSMVNDYMIYQRVSEENKNKLMDSKTYYYGELELQFRGYNEEKLQKIANNNEMYMIIYSVLTFLFINGLFLMIINSFYRRELK